MPVAQGDLCHITEDRLERGFHALKRNSAPGTDGVTWRAYGENLEAKLAEVSRMSSIGYDRSRFRGWLEKTGLRTRTRQTCPLK